MNSGTVLAGTDGCTTLQKPRLPDNTFGMHSSSELYWQSQYRLPSPRFTTAHQGPCSKARLSGTLKHSAAVETATTSINRMMVFIEIIRNIFIVRIIGALSKIKMLNSVADGETLIRPDVRFGSRTDIGFSASNTRTLGQEQT